VIKCDLLKEGLGVGPSRGAALFLGLTVVLECLLGDRIARACAFIKGGDVMRSDSHSRWSRSTACISCLVLFFLPLVVETSNSIILDGNEFVREDGEWFLDYGGQLWQVEDVLAIRFAPGLSDAAAHEIVESAGCSVLEVDPMGYYDVYVPPNRDILDRALAFRMNSAVETAQPYTRGRFCSSPDDEYYSDSWWWNNTGQHVATSGADVDAPQAWALETGDSTVIIAILDTGFKTSHGDLNYTFFKNTAEINGQTGVDDDGNGKVDDYNGWDFTGGGDNDPSNDSCTERHGSGIASIAAAETNNDYGIAGIAGGWGDHSTSNPGCRWLPCRTGSDEPLQKNVKSAIYYACSTGAKVISMSCNFGSATDAFKAALDHADSMGVLQVAAMGNLCYQCEPPDTTKYWPARHHKVLGIGATDWDDQWSGGSVIGNHIFVAAPGGSTEAGFGTYSEILQAVPHFGTCQDTFIYRSGTSEATPIVAGVAGLLFSFNSDLTSEDVKRILAESAEKVDSDSFPYDQTKEYGSWNKYLGYGRVNAYHALQLANIELTSPGGGESWVIGTQHDITWTVINADSIDSFDLLYSEDGGDSWPDTIATGISASATSYSWTIPTSASSDSAMVRLVANITDGWDAWDISDSLFTVVPVHVTEPNGGEQWVVGETDTLRWESDTARVDFVHIYLSRDGGTSYSDTLFSYSADDGKQAWTVTRAWSDSCLVKVVGLASDSTVLGSDVSDDMFSVMVVRVDVPNGGEVWEVKSYHNIEWTSDSDSVDYVDILRSKNNGQTWTTLFNDTPDDGVQSWYVTETSDSNLIRIYGERSNQTRIDYDVSDSLFKVSPGTGCPFVYALVGEEFVQDNSLLGQSVYGGSRGVDVTDSYLLDMRPSRRDGMYALELREFEGEVSFFDQVELVAVDHDPTFELAVTPDGRLGVFSELSGGVLFEVGSSGITKGPAGSYLKGKPPRAEVPSKGV